MSDTAVKLSGSGVTRLVVALGDFFSKGIDVMDHAAEVLGDAGDALKAYAQKTVHELRFETDEEYSQLKKQVALAELRAKQVGMDRRRAKLGREIQVLENRKLKLEKGSRSEVRHNLKSGTADVRLSESAKMGDGQIPPLPHHMDVPETLRAPAR